MTDTKLTKLEREFNAIFTNLDFSTANTRLDAALNFVPSGRPGADNVRQRQANIAARWFDAVENWRNAGYRRTHCSDPVRPLTVAAWRNNVEHRKANADYKRAEQSGDKTLAKQFASAYHNRIHSLYQSSRASIAYGSGGQEQTDWEAYSKNYGHSANWKDAGYRVEYTDNRAIMILENHLGTEKARLPLPTKSERGKIRFNTDETKAADGSTPLLDGDLYGVERHRGVIERFGVKTRKSVTEYISNGFAVLIETHPESGKSYWEHGATIKEIKAEVNHKRETARIKQIAQIRDARTLRMARLIVYVCASLVVKREHARALGYCNAGIDGFCDRYNLPREQATVGQIRATGNPTALRAAEVAARECAVRRLEANNATA